MSQADCNIRKLYGKELPFPFLKPLVSPSGVEMGNAGGWGGHGGVEMGPGRPVRP